jgi:HlyD family secretion protein
LIRKYLLPSFALLGALIALCVVFWSEKKTPVAPILYPPASSPYRYAIAGAGIIEASSENISIGSPFNEIVTSVYVIEGDCVKAGDLLLELDLRAFESQKKSAQATLEATYVTFSDKKMQFSFYERLKDKRAVSEQEYQLAFFALKEAEKQVKVAEAQLKEVQTNIERSRIRSPIDALVLQVNIHPGEIAPTVPFVADQAVPILLGRVNPLFVRIDIDEDDAWRFREGAPARAFVRGNSTINFPLQFVRTEPYIIPKASFTGDTTEKVDTRVLQVLYSFQKGTLPIYVGQILDIFIEAPAQ